LQLQFGEERAFIAAPTLKEKAMLVAKAKAINQWMECKDCHLQQVKPIKISRPEDRQCVHCQRTNLREISIYSK
jgi:hypothetical protein